MRHAKPDLWKRWVLKGAGGTSPFQQDIELLLQFREDMTKELPDPGPALRAFQNGPKDKLIVYYISLLMKQIDEGKIKVDSSARQLLEEIDPGLKMLRAIHEVVVRWPHTRDTVDKFEWGNDSTLECWVRVNLVPRLKGKDADSVKHLPSIMKEETFEGYVLNHLKSDD
ncbi:hypothetical protein ACHAPT_012282 [Fusarium lateritium]